MNKKTEYFVTENNNGKRNVTTTEDELTVAIVTGARPGEADASSSNGYY